MQTGKTWVNERMSRESSKHQGNINAWEKDIKEILKQEGNRNKETQDRHSETQRLVGRGGGESNRN